MGDVFKMVKESAVPTLIIVGALVKFGIVAAGPSAPEWVKPKAS
jgi:hypothetical protein